MRERMSAGARLPAKALRVFTVLVTHHADEVGALADEVIRLNAGMIVGQMPIAEFIARRAASAAATPPSAT
jgi:molybdate transport system ATP-binding protein